MTGTALMPWEPFQHFNVVYGWQYLPFPQIRYRPPRDTTDPRWAACRAHRVACDCREAEFAEEIRERRSYSAENRRFEEAIDSVLALHGRREDPYGEPLCSAPGCLHRYPCPTRNLLAPLSWRERYQSRDGIR